ncbi:syntaxin-6-like [Babylonia areolata]|uniref:syntaxin-6-like n=1 Tax=Babylonia areolata TaxID=304850 RepID=UPI003FD3FFA1
MSIQDPFFVVRDEVQQALMMARSLYSRWRDIEDKLSLVSPEEKEYTTNELRNSLRSIDWDLEDLEETVNILASIVEKNPKKFKIDEFELNDRRNFIERTRAAVQELRRQMNGPGTNHVNGTHDSGNAQGMVSSNGLGLPIRADHYARLDTPTEPTCQESVEASQQQALIEPQESHLERVGTGAGVSRNLSHQNSNEMEDQSALLDELGQEVEQPETTLSRAVKRVTAVMSLDRRQWCAISLLFIGIVILLIVFFTL